MVKPRDSTCTRGSHHEVSGRARLNLRVLPRRSCPTRPEPAHRQHHDGGQRPSEQDVDHVVLGGVHQRERHDQRIRHQQRPPAAVDALPQERRRSPPSCRRADDGIAATRLTLACPWSSSALAVCRFSLPQPRPTMRSIQSLAPSCVGLHRAEQAAVGDAARGPEHASRAGRPARRRRGGAPRRGPRRRGGQQRIDHQGRRTTVRRTAGRTPSTRRGCAATARRR